MTAKLKPKILGISGSFRTGAHSLQALKIALAAAEEAGGDVELFDPREKPLPYCYGPSEGEVKANGEEFRRLVKEADGIILSTPEYHGSFSGVIKNALDLVSFDEMEDKVCGLISVLGGASNNNALNHLRLVCRHVHAWVIPHQAAIGQAYGAFGPDGKLKEEKLQQRVERVGRDVVKFASLIRHGEELVLLEEE